MIEQKKPWRAEVGGLLKGGYGTLEFASVTEGGVPIAKIETHVAGSARNVRARAALMAAAPEMWAALRSARAVISSGMDRLGIDNGAQQEARTVLDQIAAALEKAEGK